MQTIQINAAIDSTPETDTATLNALNAARAAAYQFIESGDFREGTHDAPARKSLDETTIEQLYALADEFPFVENFTIVEFRCFSKAIAAQREEAAGIKRKRGRPKKTEEDGAKERVKDCKAIKAFFTGLRHNQLTDEYQYQKIDPKSGKLVWYTSGGDDLNQLSITLGMEHGVSIPVVRAREAFIYVARQNSYEPQAAMLDYCRKKYAEMTLEEAETILASVGTELLGSIPDEPTVEGETLRDRFMKRYFISMAYLGRNPGETLQWIPILIGPQGCGKSQLCTHMIPEQFKELFQQITLSIETLKREPYLLHSGFLIEMPEIDSNMRGLKTVEPMKNLITTRVDVCRKPYAAQPVKLIRRFGIIGTTNRSDLFQDGTGERRYMPLQIPVGFDLPWREMRDGLNVKIWAAADIIAQTMTGKELELRGFTHAEMRALTEWQGNFSQIDPWETKIIDFVRLKPEFTVDEVLTHIGVDPSRQDQSCSRRLTNLLKKLFGEDAQYKQQRVKATGRRQYFWRISNPPTIDDASEVNDFDGYYRETVG